MLSLPRMRLCVVIKVGAGWLGWVGPLFALFYYLSNAIHRLQWNFHIIELAFNVKASAQ